MFYRVTINNANEMNTYIKQFIEKVTGSSNLRFTSKDGVTDYWFTFDNNGVAVWAVDTDDTATSPEQALSTYAISATYNLDMYRKEINEEATEIEKEKAREKAKETFDEMYEAEKKQGFKGCSVSRTIYQDKLKEIDEDLNWQYTVFNTVWYRVAAENPFHVCGRLDFADVDGLDIILDMHYNDSVFMFSIYNNMTPKTTRSIVVGCAESGVSQKVFIMAHKYYCVSDTNKNAFHLKAKGKWESDKYADIPAETYTKLYTNEMLQMFKIDIDNQRNFQTLTVSGIKTPLRWVVNYIDLPWWDLSGYAVSEVLTPRVVKWNYHELRSSLSSTEHYTGLNYVSVYGYAQNTYHRWDNIYGDFVDLAGNKRSFVGDSVNKTSNNKSFIMPLLFYAKRDPHNYDDWSLIGKSNIINFVSMYNMSSGRIFQLTNELGEYANYNLWNRRMKSQVVETPYAKERTSQISSLHGYGGYVGLAFKLDRKSRW